MGERQGEMLRQFKAGYGLTQEQMGMLLGVTRKTYASWEEGKVPRSAKAKRRMSEVLELDGEGVRHELERLGGLNAQGRWLGRAVSAVASGAAMAGLSGVTVASPIVTALSFLLGGAIVLSRNQIGAQEAGVDSSAEISSGEYDDRRNVLSAAAMPPIREWLDEAGVSHRVVARPEEQGLGLTPDRVIVMDGADVGTWWLSFMPGIDGMDGATALTKAMVAHLMFARFLECAPERYRKMSVVTDDAGLYSELAKLRGHNSYRGNLSVILVDPKGDGLVAEEYVASYDDPAANETPFRMEERR